MWRAYSYFRTGVRVEGEAWFCTQAHGPLTAVGDVVIEGPDRPQHIDVEVRLWNSRGGPVAIIGVAAIDLRVREMELAVADWRPFNDVKLGTGGPRVTREFSLVPKDDPQGRVEASSGNPLVLEFRPSRGSERWARPRLQVRVMAR